MNEVEWIKALDAGATGAGGVDVAARVLHEIRHREAMPARPADALPLAALLAVLAGAGTAAYALALWVDLQEPLAAFIEPWRLVLQ
jgi:hypothetical protein